MKECKKKKRKPPCQGGCGIFYYLPEIYSFSSKSQVFALHFGLMLQMCAVTV